MTGPAEFLTARLSEDEAAAKAAAGPDWFLGSSEDSDERSIRYTGPSTIHAGALADYDIADRVDEHDAAHIVRHDPGRLLREVAAGREILTAYENAQRHYDSKVTMRDLAEDRYQAGVTSGLRQAVQELVAVYRDHPDYDPAWG